MKSTVALVLCAALAACETTTKGEGPPSGSSGATSSSSSGSSIATARCQSTCVSKVYQCSSDPSDAQPFCQGACAGSSYSDDQLSCFQSASCAEFETASRIEDVCPP